MKKIGTITTHSALNYGAVLQAYALNQYLCMQGSDCEVIDYQPDYVASSYRLINKPKSVQGLILAGYQILHYKQREERRRKFETFRKNYLRLSPFQVKDRKELIDTVNTYDLAICGSDQIWSPELHHFDEAYFLSYPEIETPKISYAASFGQDSLDEKHLQEIQRRIKGFAGFGCREYTAQTIIENLTGEKPELVLDPVFLLDRKQWRSIETKYDHEGKYVLAYFLSNPAASMYAAQNYAKENNLELLSIGFSPRDYKYQANNIYDAGPQDFLSLIDEADTVITNSFHATAFSILFHKNFFTRLSEGKESRNNRMLTLLRELGLEDRTFTDSTASSTDFSQTIDYDAVDLKLARMLEKSVEYLRRFIDDADNK